MDIVVVSVCNKIYVMEKNCYQSIVFTQSVTAISAVYQRYTVTTDDIAVTK